MRKTILICVTIAGAMILVPPAQYCFAVQTTMDLNRLLNGYWATLLLLASLLFSFAGYLLFAAEGGFWPRLYFCLSTCGLVELIIIRGIGWLAGSVLIAVLLGTLWRPLNWAKLLGVVCLFLIGSFLSIPQFFFYSPLPQAIHRATGDMRAMATAIEVYKVDHDVYPACTSTGPYAEWQSTEPMPSFLGGIEVATLTTPVAYITSYFIDPFRKLSDHRTFAYYCNGPMWIMISAGPNCRFDLPPDRLTPLLAAPYLPIDELLNSIYDYTYDPTNGAYSSGDIFRLKQ